MYNICSWWPGEPPMTGTGTLNIHLIDQNDNVPNLTVSTMDMCLSDGRSLVSITAFDLDEEPNSGPFRFNLQGDVEGKWKVDPGHGEGFKSSRHHISMKRMPLQFNHPSCPHHHFYSNVLCMYRLFCQSSQGKHSLCWAPWVAAGSVWPAGSVCCPQPVNHCVHLLRHNDGPAQLPHPQIHWHSRRRSNWDYFYCHTVPSR